MSKPAGTVWDFEIAKATISEAEKDRIVAIYFNSDVTNTGTCPSAEVALLE